MLTGELMGKLAERRIKIEATGDGLAPGGNPLNSGDFASPYNFHKLNPTEPTGKGRFLTITYAR